MSNKGKTIRIGLYILGAVFAVAVIAVLVLGSQAKSIIERVASDTMQTEVTLGSLDISFGEKTVRVASINIANPDGFNSDKAFHFGDIKVTASQLTGDELVFEEITLDGAMVFFEMLSDGDNNLSMLKNKMMARTSQSANDTAETQEKGDTKPANKKVVIKKLNLTNMELVASMPSLDKDFGSVKIPNIHLTNIGREGQGLDANVAIRRVLDQLISVSVKTAARSGIEDKINDVIGGKAKDISDKLSETLGDVGDDIGKNIGGLFD